MDFRDRKQNILQQINDSIDQSVKGSIDTHALPIVCVINSLSVFVTTSRYPCCLLCYDLSCSGRISIMADASNDAEIRDQKKKGGKWIFVSHDPVDESLDFLTDVSRWCVDDQHLNFESLNTVTFKFEPFILHLEAASLEDAKQMLAVGMQAGYRNSGIVLTESRVMVAFRHTMKLDVPIGWLDESDMLHLSVSSEYLLGLVKLSNVKFRQNFDRMDKLLKMLRETFDPSFVTVNKQLETKEERRERKRQEGLMRQAELRQSSVSNQDELR